MSSDKQHSAARLVDRRPSVSGTELVATLVPPPQFDHASFESYRPDPDYPSQAEARDILSSFAGPAKAAPRNGGGGFFGFGRKKPAEAPAPTKPGVYLDGGFGVGKTHLLAATWHATAGRKYFGTFIEYTALVGALGYSGAVGVLQGAKLICIDEFELDDPGDTMLMTRLIGDLTSTGSKIVATSNTPPNALGEGRFAASDFMREIQAMSDRFRTIRIDGVDYRQRDIEGDARVLSDDAYRFALADVAAAGDRMTDDDFSELIAHLATVHPSAYSGLLGGVQCIGLRDVQELTDQSAALRFVAFIDRVYDAQIPLRATGVPLTSIFGGGMIDGGYRKKYLRCISRLNALTASETAA
ncbi:cell division protein ZapE [Leucobacter chromiireducens]|uniref:Cell division protein ZapE n=1 Tax=Leucobacter chromiireducens subsp. chromiireducens TaxID=660067 RepID=A0ABS1SQW4_9MICO|nr:cell division protein ZapE [Leucobacter chromiireducens]MBL3690553.1 cell division protein ZapE [Leucobacter chromiireducens subsp. chromiireducens]